MAMGQCRCPNCGIKMNVRESSVGTMKRCTACGTKFVLERKPASCLAAIIVIVAATVFFCYLFSR